LPADFSLSFSCTTTEAGDRRFAPTQSLAEFVMAASVGGLAFLAQRQPGFDAERRSTYRVMQLLYQLAPHLREHFGRSFRNPTDLYLPGARNRHILPVDIGLNRDGRGAAWTPAELMKQGRNKAVELKVNPDPATCIRLGLLEAARRNPLDPHDLSETDALALVRLAAFDLGPTSIQQARPKRVQDRLLKALKRHLADDDETFGRWFANVDNIVHQIGKQKKPDGAIDREVVRQCLLEMVFRAYRYVGDCVHEQMCAFRNAIPKELNTSENLLFESLYCKQPYLGGLPLVLLHGRFEFLREFFLETWGHRDAEQQTGVLLRLLDYYRQMTNARREGDRSYKSRSNARNAAGKPARIDALTAASEAEAANDENCDEWAEITEYLRKDRNIVCPGCRNNERWVATYSNGALNGHVVALQFGCKKCNQTVEVRVTRTEFKNIAEVLRANKESA
jgi:hypothetical protein